MVGEPFTPEVLLKARLVILRASDEDARRTSMFRILTVEWLKQL
jgi:hypothetical protein